MHWYGAELDGRDDLSGSELSADRLGSVQDAVGVCTVRDPWHRRADLLGLHWLVFGAETKTSLGPRPIRSSLTGLLLDSPDAVAEYDGRTLLGDGKSSERRSVQRYI